MKTNAQIRQESLSLMKGNWGAGIGVMLVYSLIALPKAPQTNVIAKAIKL